MSKIIAEIGVNWNGNIDLAKYMITQSKLAGADYVKFQLFNKDVISGSIYSSFLSRMILGAEELAELTSHSDKVDIGFIVSCMYPESFKLAESVKPGFIKIRHTDRNNDELAKLAIHYYSNTHTKIIISSDSYDGISNIYHANRKICHYMYCVPKYPPTIEDELSIIKNHTFLEGGFWEGFSSHFKDIIMPSLAISMNIKFVEVHVSCFESDIDHNVSLSFEQLKTLCDINKGIYP